MTRNVFVILLQLLVTFLLVSMVACVDVPTTGPAVPDYRSLTRYVHAGRGIDTLALFVSSFRDSARTTRTAVTGPDTIITTIDTVRAFSTYTRIRVDFASALELLVDGTSVGTLGFGSATPYLDTPSGQRQFKLRGTGQLVDSLAIRDTLITVHIDTVRPTGKKTADFTLANRNNYFYPLTGSLTTIVDSTTTPVQLAAQSAGTLFLVGDTVARSSSRAGLVTYGWVKYLLGGERYTFGSLARPDTAVLRFSNLSKNAGGPVDIKRAGAATNDVSGLAFSGVSLYVGFPVRQDTSVTILFNRAGTPAFAYSVNVAVSRSRAYTVVLLDSANAAVARTFVDQ